MHVSCAQIERHTGRLFACTEIDQTASTDNHDTSEVYPSEPNDTSDTSELNGSFVEPPPADRLVELFDLCTLELSTLSNSKALHKRYDVLKAPKQDTLPTFETEKPIL